MSLRFVLGRSGAGKTTRCLDEIREELAGRPDGPPLILLVPEQATFQTEYALIRTPGMAGTIRAQALSFRRLAFRVMQETGGTALVPIGDNGRQMLLYRILKRLSPRLRLFHAAAEQPGFVERLGGLLTEWKRYGVLPEDVGQYAAQAAPEEGGALLDRKLHDLQLIYDELEAGMAGLYIDSEDYLTWLTAGYPAIQPLCDAHIWVDGFYGFTPKEYEALAVLIRHAKRVTFTLTLDRPCRPGEAPHELDLFLSPAETYIKLRELAAEAGAELEEPVLLGAEPPVRFAGNPVLAHVEKHFDSRLPMLAADPALLDPDDARCALSLHAAPGRRAEVEAAARDMLRRVQAGEARWRDFTVMVRSGADYHDYIADIFADNGIPHFFDQRIQVLHHPLVELIRSAMETVTQGWHYDAVFRCLKTEMLLPADGTEDREALDRLENYVLAAGIDGWRWHSDASWRPLTPDSLEDEPAEAKAADLAQLAAVKQTRDAVAGPLVKLQNALKRAGSVRAMCAALFRFLTDIGAADRLEAWSRRDEERGEIRRAREHRQLWDGVMGLLDQLVEMMGDEPVAQELFGGMLDTGLESLKLAAVPPAIDQVLVGSIDRTRAGDVKVNYMLGVNDGVMPMRVQEDGVLTEAERERLSAAGMALAPNVRRRLLEERFLIYNACTAPSGHLWLSYAQADEEGKSLYPSEIVRHIRAMFPGLAEQTAAGEPAPGLAEERQLAFVRHPERSLSYLIAELRAWKQGDRIAGLWWDVYNWFAASPDPRWRERMADLAASLNYVNREDRLSGDTALRLYGDHLRASVSRMERFVACPFQHFASHGLRLRERRQFRLEAPDIGQLFHAALSRLSAQLGDGFGRAETDQLRGFAAKAVDELTPRLQSQILLSSSRYKYIARKLQEIVAQAAVVLGEHARRSGFRPVGLEVAFGPGGDMPPLLLPLDGGRTMELVGRIDRIDAAETPNGLLLRVLDYKSSATQLRLEEVLHGLSLQMLTYLDVAVTNAPVWLGQQAEPAGVLYFHVHNPLMGASNRLEPEAARAMMLKRFKLKGLLLADEEAVRLMDGRLESGHSELLPVAIKKDGAFYGTSSVATREQFGTLRRSVRRTIRDIGTRILDGEVSIAPYRMGAKMPCQFCSFKPVCQFDPVGGGNAFVRLQKPAKEELWARLAEGEAADAAGFAFGGVADRRTGPGADLAEEEERRDAGEWNGTGGDTA